MKKINKIILVLFLVFTFRPAIGFSEEIKPETLAQPEPIVIEEIKIKNIREINKANVVVLQALNKITAKSYTYEVKVGDTMEFERLKINPLFCWKSSPSDIPENKVLIKIIENKLDKTQGEVFYGWMFSSSPGMSSLEHPMYDITIVDCKK